MAPILTLEAVSKRFDAVVIADKIDLALEEGAALGVLGPNGAGKTTLFGVIAGSVPLDSGHVRFAGADVTTLPAERRCRQGIARSFQIPQPFGAMTVFENLAVAAAFGQGRGEREVYEECWTILDRCALAAKANRIAGGLTLLDRKRLELARALATRPRLLLLDEVAGGLTEHECGEVVALVKELHRDGLTIVWIEHIVHALLAAVDRLVVLHGGKFIADGEPHAAVKSPAVQEIYMGISADA